jgi:hypothetical protein
MFLFPSALANLPPLEPLFQIGRLRALKDEVLFMAYKTQGTRQKREVAEL